MIPNGSYPYQQPEQIRDTRPIRIRLRRRQTTKSWVMPKRRNLVCAPFLLMPIMVCCLVGAYLFIPLRSHVLVLGIDYAPRKSFVGRSDTIILMKFNNLKPYVGMLSIPRDLWVTIPGVGENRINTAHFFAESQIAGSGPYAAIDTIKSNFGVQMDYFIRIRFDGVREIVNAMGGVDLDLPKPMAGYSAGVHHLSGNKALAFARSRKGADDFFRMEQGQLLVKSIFKNLLKPQKWPLLPNVAIAFISSVDTNIPIWDMPRMGFAILRVGVDNIDNRTLNREMTTSFTTSQGANVLLPNWATINPLVNEMFEK